MVTLKQIQALDAVVRKGSFQAGAQALHKTHPSVINQLKKLEVQLGFVLFDRSGYRTTLTEAGQAFYRHALRLLDGQDTLEDLARHLRQGKETRLRIVIGDVTPLAGTLQILRGFADLHPHVRLDLGFENLSGPCERLLDGEADLVVHHVDPADPCFECQSVTHVAIIPVVAPGFLDIEVHADTRYEALKPYLQCIIRDTAQHSTKDSYFVLDDAPCMTVGDQHTKKAVILQGMAWGHMPDFLIADELETGALVSIAGRYIKGINIDIVAARLGTGQKGIMAEHLWHYFNDKSLPGAGDDGYAPIWRSSFTNRVNALPDK